MDWTRILERAGCPDSPGRVDAVNAAVQLSEAKKAQKAKPKARNTSRPNRFPGLKHGTD